MDDLRYQKVIHHLILEQLRKEKKITLRVSGRSMYPLIRKGDPIYVGQCNPRVLSIGDIITFKKNDIYITHRVLWITRKGSNIGFMTKGDNEITVDTPVSPRHIVGKVVAIQRGDQTLHLETPSWRFMNRLLGLLFLVETISILLYRFGASTFIPLRTFVHATFEPSLLYRRLKNRGLNFATRIIM